MKQAVTLFGTFIRYLVVAVVLRAAAYGADAPAPEKIEVKDRNGVAVLTISNIRLFRRSAPVFQGVVQNVSGVDLTLDTLTGTIHKKDGSTVQFSFNVCDVRWCDFPKDSAREVSYPFPKPWPFAAGTVASLDVSLPGSWESPEDVRIAAERAKESAAESERNRTLAGVVAYDGDIIPESANGNLVIQNPQFIVRDQFNIYEPLLTFRIVDKSSVPWDIAPVQFDMGGVCNGDVRQWSASIVLQHSTLVLMTERGIKNYDYPIDSLNGKVQGCRTDVIKVRVGGPAIEPLDLRPEVEALRMKRESEEADRVAAEATAKAERDRITAAARAKREAREAEQSRAAAQAKARKDAADAADRKRLADEQKKRDAEEEAEAAEKRRTVRAACAAIYKNTVDKKISDLTVREEQQVRACQTLGLYPPQ